MDTYELKITNHSSKEIGFTLFQKAPDTNNGRQVFTLAWLSRFARTGATINFTWEIQYNAIWSQPGEKLEVGVICDASQVETKSKSSMSKTTATSSGIVDVSIDGSNTITLNYDKSNNAFYFDSLTAGNKGKIFTSCADCVPHSLTTSPSTVAGIGIGMSGYGTFLVGAQPNIEKIWNIKEPAYYLVAGDYKTGEILDSDTIKKQALEVTYNGVLKRSARYDENEQLKIVD
ncbi:MAG: hypothetical protein GY757_59600 [bacterium]|nr:hypothetical protein [bacterium]